MPESLARGVGADTDSSWGATASCTGAAVAVCSRIGADATGAVVVRTGPCAVFRMVGCGGNCGTYVSAGRCGTGAIASAIGSTDVVARSSVCGEATAFCNSSGIFEAATRVVKTTGFSGTGIVVLTAGVVKVVSLTSVAIGAKRASGSGRTKPRSIRAT